jgi:uncharacterized protein (DUF1810 family)
MSRAGKFVILIVFMLFLVDFSLAGKTSLVQRKKSNKHWLPYVLSTVGVVAGASALLYYSTRPPQEEPFLDEKPNLNGALSKLDQAKGASKIIPTPIPSGDISDPHNLKRFVDAMEGSQMSHVKALSELNGKGKQTHWIWPNFPQLEGLATNPSANSSFYSIKSKEEAKSYLAHEKLGPWLEQKAEAALRFKGSVLEFVGCPIDTAKLKSSMTLFDQVSSKPNNIYRQVLNKYFNGQGDTKTLDLLRAM